MTEMELDGLMNEVLREVANPLAPAGLEERVRAGRMAMGAAGNVLEFGTLGLVEGRAVSRGPMTAAALVNLAAVLLLMVEAGRGHVAAIRTEPPTSVVFAEMKPVTPPKPEQMGGGGGQKGVAPVTKGNPPKFAPEQLNPPKAPPLDQPKIQVESTVNVQQDVRMAKVDVPNFGVPNAPNVGMSLGNGSGSGIGGGMGDGVGPGANGGNGGGLHRVGGSVSAPVILFQPEPEFSEEARKAKVSGNVLVYLQVDAVGRPTHVRVLRGIGMGLDERAMAAVRLYKFKPAMENGRAVAVEMNVEVNFNIY